jgi:hypothetical protein
MSRSVLYVALGPDEVRQRGRSCESVLPWDSVHRVLRMHVDVPTVIVGGYPDGVWERRRTSLWKIDRLGLDDRPDGLASSSAVGRLL